MLLHVCSLHFESQPEGSSSCNLAFGPEVDLCKVKFGQFYRKCSEHQQVHNCAFIGIRGTRLFHFDIFETLLSHFDHDPESNSAVMMSNTEDSGDCVDPFVYHLFAYYTHHHCRVVEFLSLGKRFSTAKNTLAALEKQETIDFAQIFVA